MNINTPIIDMIKSNVELFKKMLISIHNRIAIRPIIKYVPNFVKSILVLIPTTAKIAKTIALIKNTKINEFNSNATKYTENDNPVTNEYNKKHIFAVVGLILCIFADRNTTNPISTISKISSPQVVNKFSSIFGFIDTKYPVINVNSKPINIHPNTLGNILLFILSSLF